MSCHMRNATRGPNPESAREIRDRLASRSTASIVTWRMTVTCGESARSPSPHHGDGLELATDHMEEFDHEPL